MQVRRTVVVVVGMCLVVACAATLVQAEPAAVPDIAGAWHTSFADLYLRQDGCQVSGWYAYKGGSLSGTITDNRLDYQWSQQDGRSGSGHFIISADGTRMEGSYRYDDDADGGGPWRARRYRPLVTQLQAAEEALGSLAAALTSGDGGAAVLCAADGSIVQADRRFAELIGVAQNQLAGLPDPLQALPATQGAGQQRALLRRNNGAPLAVCVRTWRIAPAAGSAARVLKLVRPVAP